MNKKLLALIFAGITVAPAVNAEVTTWQKYSTKFFLNTNPEMYDGQKNVGNFLFYTLPAGATVAATSYLAYAIYTQGADKVWTAMKQCFTDVKAAWAFDKGVVISTYTLVAAGSTVLAGALKDLFSPKRYNSETAANNNAIKAKNTKIDELTKKDAEKNKAEIEQLKKEVEALKKDNEEIVKYFDKAKKEDKKDDKKEDKKKDNKNPDEKK
jgi:predicted RNase H-like nuclease (RuvC/YqgF family)